MALSKIGSAGLDTLSGNLIVEGNVGVGTSSPDSNLHVLSTTLPQVKIDYNGTYYTTISNNGALNVVDPGTDNKWVFLRNGTEQMRIDSAGRVTMPYQPCFSMDANGTVYGNSNVILSRGLNVGNCVNTSTGVFTAPVSGVYQFTAYSIKNNSSGTVARLTLKINGSAVGEARMDESGNYCQAAMIFIAQLSANDTANFANTDSTGFYMDGFYGRCTGQLIG